MKVICIDGARVGQKCIIGNHVLDDEVIIEGERYTVCWEGRHPLTGHLSYKLIEKPVNVHYLQSRFIPLSSIDETEMILKTKNETVSELIK